MEFIKTFEDFDFGGANGISFYPVHSVGANAPLRHRVLTAIRDAKGIPEGEIVKLCTMEWIRRNMRFLVLNDGIYALSPLGERFLDMKSGNCKLVGFRDFREMMNTMQPRA